MLSQTAVPRIAPLAPPYDPDDEVFLRKWMPSGEQVEPLRLFRTLAVHREFASRMRPLGAGILTHGLLAPQDREIVILRTCARTGAEYEWGVHVPAYGTPLGLSDAQVAATACSDAEDPAFSPRQSMLVRLADELHDTCTVSDELWAALAEEFSEPQLLELLIVAGQYRLISYLVNGVRIEREPWAARFPS